MAGTIARFVVNASGQKKKLFSVADSKRGDLFVSVAAGETHQLTGTPVKELRLSIHPSPNMLTKNHIKLQRLSEDGSVDEMHVHTKVLKSPGYIVPIIFRQSQNLSPARYDAGSKSSIVCGDFDEKKFTLFWAICVSHRSAEIVHLDAAPLLNISEHTFGDLKLLLLTTYLSVPAPSFSNWRASATDRTQVDENGKFDAVSGVPWVVAEMLAIEQFMLLANKMFDRLGSDLHNNQDFLVTVRAFADFFPIGFADDNFYAHWRERLATMRYPSGG